MRIPLRVIAIVLGLLVLTPCVMAADDGFTPLFDSKTLAGWTFIVKPDKDGKKADPKQTWSVVDGTIRCTGKPNGCAVTEKEYGDYVLKVKWRFPAGSKGGNSGVLLHVQDDKYWPTSVEAQLLSGRAGDLWLIYPPECKLDVDKARQDPKQARHYFRIEPTTPVEKKIGEWNEYEITCRGGDITLVVNGVKVNEGKNGNFKKGRIALQSEGTEISFKDIAIKSLK
jgi:3-keto-disaccharide hydrolase